MPAASEPKSVKNSTDFVDEASGIRDVWAHNLEDEFKNIRQIVQRYKYIVMDTKFPGIINQPIEEFQHSTDYPYQLLKYKVDFLKIIQLDLTILDANGIPPPGFTKWRFNFKLNFTEDLYDQNCIELLTSSGFHYLKHEKDGIDSYEFAELLMTSGVVLCDNVNWISFHSGYDFGYLLKLLTDKNLPTEESEFLDLLKVYFPTIIKSSKNMKVGLQEVLKHSYMLKNPKDIGLSHIKPLEEEFSIIEKITHVLFYGFDEDHISRFIRSVEEQFFLAEEDFEKSLLDYEDL